MLYQPEPKRTLALGALLLNHFPQLVLLGIIGYVAPAFPAWQVVVAVLLAVVVPALTFKLALRVLEG